MNRKFPTPGFRIEREMNSSARTWLARLGLMVKQEFYTPWGICDFVGISFDSARVKQRLDLGQKKTYWAPDSNLHTESHSRLIDRKDYEHQAPRKGIRPLVGPGRA